MQATFGTLGILSAAASLLVGVLGGWIGAYLKVKGESLAIKEDFARSLERLRLNTATVEDVKQLGEDRARRRDKSVSYLERQIEEFYGPLFNLGQQIILANHVQAKILHGPGAAGKLSDAQSSEVQRFFVETYFSPLHFAISDILKSKLYLVEGTRMPRSFYRYLRHALQEAAQAQLWQERHIDTSFVRGEPFPDAFFEDIQRHLDALMDRYSELISNAHDPVRLEPPAASRADG